MLQGSSHLRISDQVELVHLAGLERFGSLCLRTNLKMIGVYINFLLMFVQLNIYHLTITAARFNMFSEDFAPSRVCASCRVTEFQEIEFDNQSGSDWFIHYFFLLIFIQSNIYRLNIDGARFNISSEDFGPSTVGASCRVREIRHDTRHKKKTLLLRHRVYFHVTF